MFEGARIYQRLVPARRVVHDLRSMKIATFNVNGVKGRLPRLLEWLEEAKPEFERAASLTRNARERALLLERAAACAAPAS